MRVLRTALRGAQAAVLGLVAYDAVIAQWGWRDRRPAPPGTRRRPLRIVVPAHDEARVLRPLLDDLAAQDYPCGSRRVVVVADRCEDETAEVARATGAEVVERRDGEPGKGAALAWYLGHEPLRPGEALVVLDADNRIDADLLGRLADELDDGHDVLQCYLDVSNPDASPLATASALTYWAGNRSVQLARTNLGWSADLGGTGTCVTAEALAAAGGVGVSRAEDRELTARLVLAGHRVAWLHDVRVHDEKPSDLGVAVRQRARWVQGKREVTRAYLGPLLARAVRRRDLGALDLAVRTVQPGRSFVALLCGVLAALPRRGGGWLLPRQRFVRASAVQLALPFALLVRERVPARYLVRYPLVTLIAGLWVPIRVLSRVRGRVPSWYHTPHGTSHRGSS